MFRKVASLGATILALGGFGLAFTLSNASARRVAHDCTYVEGTCAAGSSVVISPRTTPVGTVVGPGITVTSVGRTSTVLNDHGQSVTVPNGSTLTATPDGTLLVATNSAANGVSTVRIFRGKVAKMYVQTVKGVNFGYRYSAAALLKKIHFYSGTKRARGVIYGLNSYRGSIGLKLRKPTQTARVSISTKALKFTPAERRYIISHKVKNAIATLRFTTTARKVYTFRIRIPITKLTLDKLPKKRVPTKAVPKRK
jgi:hypothetical protein